MSLHKSIQAFTIILILFSLISCFSKKSDFHAYRYQIVDSGIPIPIKTNGFYAPVDAKACILFMFENGIVKEGPCVSDFFDNKSKYFDIITRDWYTQKSKEYFGCYMIKDSSLQIQLFNVHSSHNPVFRRWVFESNGVIKSDSTFVLINNFEYLNQHEFYEKPVLFKFVPYENKPDSSNAWFNKKRWFKKNLHESRK